MIKQIILTTILLSSILTMNAQIGYQVAVMDQSTGQPKANKEVSVKIELTDNSGKIIATTTQSETTNDFGVVSVQIGNSSTFDDMDWSKLPLWVSASVDGVSVGRTQVLTVPVAEHTIHYGTLTPEILASKSWSWTDGDDKVSAAFSTGGSGSRTFIEYKDGKEEYKDTISGTYYIVGDMVVIRNSEGVVFLYLPDINALYDLRAHVILR